jgi:hypothetical protein
LSIVFPFSTENQIHQPQQSVNPTQSKSIIPDSNHPNSTKTMIQSTKMKPIALLSVGCLAAAFPAQAALTLTNGNFNSGITPGANQNNIADWFDGNNHPTGFWEDTWQSTTNLPSGHSGGVAALSGAVGATNFLYQAIGTRDSGDATLNFLISVGAFSDVAGTRTGTLNVGLYEQTGSFTGADGTDIHGAGGITQVGSTLALSISRVGGPGAVASSEAGSFDISGTSTSNPLYLRFQWSPTASSYMNLDNAAITVIPEPSAALLGGLGMLALFRRRRA